MLATSTERLNLQLLVLSLAGLAQIKWLEGQQEPEAVLLGAADALTYDGDLLPFSWFTEEWQEIRAELRPIKITHLEVR